MMSWIFPTIGDVIAAIFWIAFGATLAWGAITAHRAEVQARKDAEDAARRRARIGAPPEPRNVRIIRD